MATTTAPNQRASLLSGLRTGGVRSTSATVPHTAAPGGSFNIPRFVSASYGQSYPEEDEAYDDDEYDDDAQLADLATRNMRFGGNGNGQPPRMQLHPPLTAAVDGSQNRFAMQQQHTAARNHHQMAALGLGAGMNIPNPHMHAQQQQQQQQQQALQMQMMQIEMLRLQARAGFSFLDLVSVFLRHRPLTSVSFPLDPQAIQAQQYQAELFAQAQFQQQQQQQQRSYQPPASAGPLATSFGSSQLRRPSQAELLRTQLGLDDQQQQMQVPMTAALGGKFGGRLQIATEHDEFPGARGSYASPMTPTPTQANHTGVISGGAALGGGNGGGNGGGQQQQQQQPSKSDSAVSWRRSSTNHSVLRRSPPPAMPDVKITPPPLDTSSLPTSNRGSPSPNPLSSTGQPRTRPSPLRFSPPTVGAASPIIAISGSGAGSTADESEEDGSASEPSSGKSSPATPQSQSPPLPPSPRDGKAYDSLGLGRPNQGPIQVAIQRVNRQPRGPPAGADELGPKNFAARIRKRAIGGLGALLENRERREDVVGA